MRPLAASTVAATLALALPAFADEPPRMTSRADTPFDDRPQAKGTSWDAWLWARARATRTSRFPLDDVGTTEPLASTVETRLRAGASGRPVRGVELHLEVDALSGLAAGDTTTLGTATGAQALRYRTDRRFGVARLDLRQAFAAVDLPFGQLRLGRMAFSWGTGMVANGGGGEPDFGDARFGDLVNRVVFATKPFARTVACACLRELTLFVGGDLVHRDENADFAKGDRAYAGVLGARTETSRLGLGAFVAMRRQTDREDPTQAPLAKTEIHATAVDLWAKGVVAKRGSVKLSVEGEAAFVFGTTTRPYLEETRDGAKIRSFGAVARSTVEDEALRLRFRSELGYASGDADPHDDVVRTFAFDPDRRVGLLLFDPIIAHLSARAADRVVDPSLLAVRPPATRFTMTQGAVSNTVYWNPVVRFRPIERLDLRAGWLVAFAAADLVDPWQSAKAGGYNATWGGRSPGSRALGHEIDLGAKWSFASLHGATFRAGAEGGVLFPGRAFDGLGMGKVALVRGGLDVVY